MTTLDPPTLLVAIALLTTHPRQPVGRDTAARLAAWLKTQPVPTEGGNRRE